MTALALWEAENTLASVGLTRARVLALTGQDPAKTVQNYDLPRVPRRACNPVNTAPIVPPPTNRTDAARAVVDLMRAGGISACQALASQGFASCYSTAANQCLHESGPLWDLAKAGQAGHSKGGVCFVRWFLNLPPINGVEHPDNDRLRRALLAYTGRMKQLAIDSGVHETTIYSIRSGGQRRMRADVRRRIFEALA